MDMEGAFMKILGNKEKEDYACYEVRKNVAILGTIKHTRTYRFCNKVTTQL